MCVSGNMRVSRSKLFLRNEIVCTMGDFLEMCIRYLRRCDNHRLIYVTITALPCVGFQTLQSKWFFNQIICKPRTPHRYKLGPYLDGSLTDLHLWYCNRPTRRRNPTTFKSNAVYSSWRICVLHPQSLKTYEFKKKEIFLVSIIKGDFKDRNPNSTAEMLILLLPASKREELSGLVQKLAY